VSLHPWLQTIAPLGAVRMVSSVDAELFGKGGFVWASVAFGSPLNDSALIARQTPGYDDSPRRSCQPPYTERSNTPALLLNPVTATCFADLHQVR
jgi:hypothetical protein